MKICIFDDDKPLSMKKILLIILLFTTAMAYAQDGAIPSAQDGKVSFLKRLTTRVDLFTDIWKGGNDTIKPGTLNPGISFYVTIDNPLGEKKTPWSYSYGLGLTSQNFYNNDFIGYRKDANGVYVTYYYKIPSKTTDNLVNVTYKKNKEVFTYLDAPLEFRYHKGPFRAAVGMKFGLLLGASSKYKGTDVNDKLGSITLKESTTRNMETTRYGATFSIGYGILLFNGYYQLSKIYSDGLGPQLYPISLGISLRPFK
jgi:hypothetical protein